MLHEPRLHDALGFRRGPVARLNVNQLDARMLLERGFGPGLHDVRSARAGNAGHHQDVALAAEFVNKVLSESGSAGIEVCADFSDKVVGLHRTGAQDHRNPLGHRPLNR